MHKGKVGRCTEWCKNEKKPYQLNVVVETKFCLKTKGVKSFQVPWKMLQNTFQKTCIVFLAPRSVRWEKAKNWIWRLISSEESIKFDLAPVLLNVLVVCRMCGERGRQQHFPADANVVSAFFKVVGWGRWAAMFTRGSLFSFSALHLDFTQELLQNNTGFSPTMVKYSAYWWKAYLICFAAG